MSTYINVGYDSGLSPTAQLIDADGVITPVTITETPASSGNYRVSFVGIDAGTYELQLHDGGYLIYQEAYLWNGSSISAPTGEGDGWCRKVIMLSEHAKRDEGKITKQQVWFVEFSADTDALNCLTASAGGNRIPQLGEESTNGNITTRVVDINIERLDPLKSSFHVTVDFSTDQLSRPDQQNPNAPFAIEYAESGVIYTEEIYKTPAPENKVCRNLAGEPLNPPLTMDYYDVEIRISFSTASPLFSVYDVARGKVNSNTVTYTVGSDEDGEFNLAPHTLKCVAADVRKDNGKVTDDGKSIWRVELRFVYRADTWIAKVQSRGFMHLDADDNLIKNTDDNGEPFNEPQFHTDDGYRIVAPGEELPPPMEFKNFKTLDFTELFTGITVIP